MPSYKARLLPLGPATGQAVLPGCTPRTWDLPHAPACILNAPLAVRPPLQPLCSPHTRPFGPSDCLLFKFPSCCLSGASAFLTSIPDPGHTVRNAQAVPSTGPAHAYRMHTGSIHRPCPCRMHSGSIHRPRPCMCTLHAPWVLLPWNLYASCMSLGTGPHAQRMPAHDDLRSDREPNLQVGFMTQYIGDLLLHMCGCAALHCSLTCLFSRAHDARAALTTHINTSSCCFPDDALRIEKRNPFRA